MLRVEDDASFAVGDEPIGEQLATVRNCLARGDGRHEMEEQQRVVALAACHGKGAEPL